MALLVTCGFTYLCTYAFCQQKGQEQKIDGFSLAQYEEGGLKKWELNGKTAQVDGSKINIKEISGLIFGEDTALKLRAAQGKFNKKENLVYLEDNVIVKSTDGMRLTADALVWDAGTKNVFTDTLVNIKKSDFEVSGTGAKADLEQKTAELEKGVTANITSVAPAYLAASHPSTGLETSKPSITTVITCDGPLEINYKKNRAAFQNNVKVQDREGNIFADRIDLYFNPATRSIKCVVARGNVKIVNGESVTYSEKAIYLVDEGRVVLPKRPKLIIQNESHE